MSHNPVAALSREDRARRLRDSFAKNDRVRQSRTNPDIWLVSSSTYPNVWYKVNRVTCTCGCAGYLHRGVCRHLVRVSWELHQRKQQGKEVSIAI